MGLGLIANEYVTKNESFDESNAKGMSKYDEKVELIFLSPLPHVSVRMGGNVYNYGVLDIDRWNLETLNEQIGFGEALSGNHTRVELNLNEEERERLRDYLEEDVGRVYPLFLPFVDCVSQTNKAIEYATGQSPPPIANRSQAMSIAYYKLLKLVGSNRVGDITFAHRGNAAIEKAKDAAVNVFDSMFFMRYGPALLVSTPLIDRYKGTIDPITLEFK